MSSPWKQWLVVEKKDYEEWGNTWTNEVTFGNFLVDTPCPGALEVESCFCFCSELIWDFCEQDYNEFNRRGKTVLAWSRFSALWWGLGNKSLSPNNGKQSVAECSVRLTVCGKITCIFMCCLSIQTCACEHADTCTETRSNNAIVFLTETDGDTNTHNTFVCFLHANCICKVA